MKNFLIQWETEEKNRKIGGNVLLINRKLAELEYDAKCASLIKLTKLVKKHSNLTKTGKKKPHCLIFYFLTCFVEPVRQPYFCFVKSLTSLIDCLAISRAESRGGKIAINFSG